MITPLGQRQILTTAAVEVARQAHEGAIQGQLQVARRQAALDRMTEAHEEVPQVEGSEDLRLNPDHSPQDQGGAAGGGFEEHHDEAARGSEGAGPAEGHLDLLA